MKYIKENIKDLSVIFLIIVWTVCQFFIESTWFYIISCAIVCLGILFFLPLNYQKKMPKYPRLRFRAMQYSFFTMVTLVLCVSFINSTRENIYNINAIDIVFFGAFIQSCFFLMQKWYFNK